MPVMGDDYSGWFRGTPEPDRPEWAQQQVDDSNNRAMWEQWAVQRLPTLQAAVPVRAGRRTPCMAVGVMVDDNGVRYPMIAISGDGMLPESIVDLKHPRERAAGLDGENLHAEQRLVRQAEAIRQDNEQSLQEGLPVSYPGLKLESVAASYPICWKRCQPELAREGTKALTPMQPPPPETQPAKAPPKLPAGPAYDPQQTRRRGPRR